MMKRKSLRIAEKIVDVLKPAMKKTRQDNGLKGYSTDWGWKTDEGLVATVETIITKHV